MSAIYELLDDYLQEYDRHKSETEFNALNQASNRLDRAMQEETLTARLQGLREATEMSKSWQTVKSLSSSISIWPVS